MRNHISGLVLGLMFLAGSTSARAQDKWEISPFGGWETSGSFPVNNSTTVDRLRADTGVSFGSFVGHSLTENAQFEFMWNRNLTSFSQHNISTGTYTKAFNSDIDQYQFGFDYMIRATEHRLRPFISAGLGFTHFANSGNTPNQTKFSFGFGGGVKYYPTRHFGLRGEGRYVPTYENKTPQQFCDIFGNCFISNVANYLHRVNFTGGLTLRF